MRSGPAALPRVTDPAGTAKRIGLAMAGPLLIAGSVLLVLHSIAFGGRLTFTQPDIPALWLPNYCHLGTSLLHGSLPTWNPYVMGGLPFAADPQSGWMYLIPTVLFSTMSCGAALRWFVVIHPILAGLGIYWFLRAERVSRPAATVGGLVLAAAVAGSRLVVDVPFPGALAWSALLLAAAAHCLHADRWPARLGWVALTALAWGQLAATHLSHGLVIGSVLLLSYVVMRTVVDLRSGRRTIRDRALLLVLLLGALPLVNLAYFYPRFLYIPSTTMGYGYGGLASLGEELAGRFVGPHLPGPTSAPRTIVSFAFSPGTYLGAVALAVAFAGWWSSRLRPLVATFTAAFLVFYLASLHGVAFTIAHIVRRLPFGDVYLQSPWRFRYGALFALAVLAGLGVEAWREPASARRRVAMLAPGVVLWWLLPWFDGPGVRLALLVVGAVAAAGVLTLVVRRPALAAVIPAVLAVELVANGLLGQAPHADQYSRDAGVMGTRQPPFNALGPTRIDVASYLQPDAFVRDIQNGPGDRFISLNPTSYLDYTEPGNWPYLTNQRAMLFGIEDAQGYNSIEPLRYWTYVRSVTPQDYAYNNAVILRPPPSALDLLQVGWEIAPEGMNPSPGFRPYAHEGPWTLYRGPDVPRASFVSDWTVTDEQSALDAVTRRGFQPEKTVVLETPPGLSPSRVPGGTASFQWLSTQEARVDVDAPSAGIVLVRNTFDDNWHATVDGHPAPLLRADYFLQGIPVTSGQHTIVLTYRDPAIGVGLAGSGVVLVLLLGAAVFLSVRRRRPMVMIPVAEERPAIMDPVSAPVEVERTPAGQAAEGGP
jgi:Bacterial membrane protein YfhO